MRSRQPLISALLALALLASPVLAGAHNPDHALQPGGDHACAVCVYAHGAGAGALPTAPVVVIAGVIDAPDAAPTTAFTAVTVRLHPIRGPPSLLA